MGVQPKKTVTLDDLAAELFSEQLVRDLNQIEVQEAKVWPMRWFFLIFVMIWLLAAMIVPVVVFVLTKNLLAFTLFTTLAPPIVILYRITRYLFPWSENDYKLAEKKVELRRHSDRPLARV